jgi:hypothetical protein
MGHHQEPFDREMSFLSFFKRQCWRRLVTRSHLWVADIPSERHRFITRENPDYGLACISTIKWDDKHNDPDARLILVASDGTHFRVSPWYMSKKRSACIPSDVRPPADNDEAVVLSEI